MKNIPLTKGKVALVDDEDYERLSKYKWYALEDKYTSYAIRNIVLPSGERSQIRMHRELLGITDLRVDVDHKDRNGLNNQRCNLRGCSRSINLHNARKHVDALTSQYKGVYFYKRHKKWMASISVNKQRIFLGYYPLEVDAACAYDATAVLYFGEFARLNFAH